MLVILTLKVTSLNLGLWNVSFLVTPLVSKVIYVLISTLNVSTSLGMLFSMSQNSLSLLSLYLHLIPLLPMFLLVHFGSQISYISILSIIPLFLLLFLVMSPLSLLLFHFLPHLNLILLT